LVDNADKLLECFSLFNLIKDDLPTSSQHSSTRSKRKESFESVLSQTRSYIARHGNNENKRKKKSSFFIFEKDSLTGKRKTHCPYRPGPRKKASTPNCAES
jgi:hypothetical protein